MSLVPVVPEKSPAKITSPLGFSHWMGRVVHEWERAGADLAADPVHDLRVALASLPFHG